eukprot:358619-Chlamydomonas_euryale.AAC.10
MHGREQPPCVAAYHHMHGCMQKHAWHGLEQPTYLVARVSYVLSHANACMAVFVTGMPTTHMHAHASERPVHMKHMHACDVPMPHRGLLAQARCARLLSIDWLRGNLLNCDGCLRVDRACFQQDPTCAGNDYVSVMGNRAVIEKYHAQWRQGQRDAGEGGAPVCRRGLGVKGRRERE